jgi:hypothetical protein
MNHGKKVIALIAGTLAIAFSVNVNAKSESTQYSGYVPEASLVKVCEALQSNNKLKLKNAIENTRINKRTMSKKLKCNGMDPVSFALSVNADKTAGLVAKYSGIKTTDTRIAKK